ncbi:hypothetical protein V6N12_075915 [Hibiscus sabdariffa]|uniref:Uncharacterized protein n=1 Tax=Hibiscus sabdariffa TaxID=183260 RepID=A0ABR2AYA0_9ROSI
MVVSFASTCFRVLISDPGFEDSLSRRIFFSRGLEEKRSGYSKPVAKGESETKTGDGSESSRERTEFEERLAARTEVE